MKEEKELMVAVTKGHYMLLYRQKAMENCAIHIETEKKRILDLGLKPNGMPGFFEKAYAEMIIHLPSGTCIKNRYGAIHKEEDVMHTTIVKTKDGKDYCGYIQLYRPEYSFMTLMVGNELVKLDFNDMESAVTLGERVSINEIADQDEIQRAKKFLADSRKYGWRDDCPKELYAWEK